VVADGVANASAATPITDRLAKISGVVAAAPMAVDNGVAVIRVTPSTGPNDDATTDLVNGIRDNRVAVSGDSGAKILVGGTTANVGRYGAHCRHRRT